MFTSLCWKPDKLKGEVSYFYDPTSIISLVGSGIFPSVSLITGFYLKFLKNLH